ncbi:CoA-binding protein [Desulfatitalea alkaliphila]|uniref:CoA-binding protein n=1 Tax=Desulfatitalea alkaliphila TaxID=2929485 RepID=A0AA41UK87_9BACT|nr:CoA-binding protein [Desulfatitalea alkaliphila]MCJ8501192.1 CoA-binding protein [Desulfatitalea alkaliphila]
MNDMPSSTVTTDFERIFHPRRIAIVGVSTRGPGFGSGIFHSLRTIGFEGEIFLVNPKGGTLDGVPILPSVADIPGAIDFAIIAVQARAVPEALELCRRKGAAGAEIFSSGFKELGTEEGRLLEQQVVQVARRGIRVIGPNCFGIYCPASGLTVLPGPDLSRESGPVAFLSQSGGMAIDFANTGKSIGLRFSKMVSFGNGADLREVELLRYLTDDAETGVITLYIEGVADGAAFFDAMRAAARRKPVIVYKGGLSNAGARAVQSHTASMGGSRRIWRAMLRQVNAVQVRDLPEMSQAALAFAMLPPRPFRRISVLGGGGALGVAAADAAEPFGLTIPAFDPPLVERIEAILPRPGSSAGNPVDVANPFVAPEVLKEVLLLAAEDPRIELQIFISLLSHYKNMARMMGLPVKEVAPYRDLAAHFQEVARRTGKPVVVVLPNPRRGLDHLDVVEMIALARRTFMAHGIVVFDELHEALRAIGHLNVHYGRKTV